MGGRKKILVADDDRMMREMLRMILVRAGYDVVFAEDGEAAVEKAISERPDLVLADGLMPKMHGFVACKMIKALHASPKVILLTATMGSSTEVWKALREYDADAMLNKPFKPAELLSCINTHIAMCEVPAAA